ncbi:hypothetical protein Dimus_017577 [Dionaea muscipula]
MAASSSQPNMIPWKYSFPFLLFLFLCSSSVTPLLNRDAEVLIRVNNAAISDPDTRLRNWIPTGEDDPCNWTGVTCNSNHSLISIDISSMGLSGPFPSGLCRVRTLQNLTVSDNSFNGTLSLHSLSFCSQLRKLNISFNEFVGPLPDFSPGFADLRVLDFSANNFSGDIPESYGRLPALQVLKLFGNLLDGTVPKFLTNLTELTHFDLAYNPFKPSRLPLGIGSLTKLENLWMPFSNLIGDVPESVGGLVSLVNLDLSSNSLSGRIPDSIGKLRSVVQIELYENQLSDDLPESLGNRTSLRRFDVSQNNLTG